MLWTSDTIFYCLEPLCSANQFGETIWTQYNRRYRHGNASATQQAIALWLIQKKNQISEDGAKLTVIPDQKK